MFLLQKRKNENIGNIGTRVMEIRKIKTKAIPTGKTSSPSTPCLTPGAFGHLIQLKKHRSRLTYVLFISVFSD